ncbi:MAG: SagB/ThcOx family dehydrogenase [Clostridiales bacterium]|nr:SagB/ThcOx family dehydrogenase [Clostridiales bacterium]
MDGSEKLHWSPCVRWRIEGDALLVENFIYKNDVYSLFPKFYFVTSQGALYDDMRDHFKEFNPRILQSFVKDLARKKVLVKSIVSPKELFYSQKDLFNNDYPESIIYVTEELEAFKKKQAGRVVFKGARGIALDDDIGESVITTRKTHRVFDTKKKINFRSFSNAIGVFKSGTDRENGRYYASAGGLYPIDIYAYIKKDRVENVPKGLYYYNPIGNVMELVDERAEFTRETHYLTNKEIFDTSAATVFFIYNCECNMPKYGGMGYFYAILDAGIMVQTLTLACESENISVCSIGDMLFDSVKDKFRLSPNQTHLHAMELGYPKI